MRTEQRGPFRRVFPKLAVLPIPAVFLSCFPGGILQNTNAHLLAEIAPRQHNIQQIRMELECLSHHGEPSL